jgi:hypothetical protein
MTKRGLNSRYCSYSGEIQSIQFRFDDMRERDRRAQNSLGLPGLRGFTCIVSSSVFLSGI